jgi:hypothetical protein
MNDFAVKIDYKLKKRIEKLISKDYNNIEYPSIKNFIDKAVLKMLDEVDKDDET